MVLPWLHILALASLALGVSCAILIVADEIRDPQQMWIMNVVWPLTALFGSLLWTWGYFRFGKHSTQRRAMAARKAGREPPGTAKPFGWSVAEAASHCGAGCTLGDIVAESLAFAVPGIAVWFGWHWLFAEKMFAVWVLDFAVAFCFGVLFQYFTIAPMRNLGLGTGLWAAVKADALSLTAWQVGMYGFMAFPNFVLFQRWLGIGLEAPSPEFWFMMQTAMLCGFATSYPVNAWLLHRGWKEAM
jgi:hypothetical protein